MVHRVWTALLASAALAVPAAASTVPQGAAQSDQQADQESAQFVPPVGSPGAKTSPFDDRLTVFTPTSDPIRHQIDYEVWDYALKNITLSMGPSSRKGAPRPDPILGSRIKHGPQSRYRLEGSLVLFRFFDQDVIASFTEYRQDLERVTDTLDIASLPRNEQLAFWLNLHNVALMEQLAKEWPVREPRDIAIGGVPLDDAKFITLRGIPVSLRDIRENIVFRHWKDPKVIYGFWRGEIGGPELQSHAFTGANVGALLDVIAGDFVNSLRGTQQRGDTLEVATLYGDVAPFYFPNFEADVRAHLARYADEPVAELLNETRQTRASISERDIADLHGGARPPNYLTVTSTKIQGPMSDRMGQAAISLLAARERKLETMRLRGQATARVFFSNIELPGDPPNKNAVE